MPESAPDAVASWQCELGRTLLGSTRSGVYDFLRAAGVDSECVERSVVALDELVTNAVEHAGSRCELWVSVRRRWVRISVHDWAPVDFSGRWFRPGRQSGLALVARLSAQLFLQPAHRGKYVVALVPRWRRGEPEWPIPAALQLPF